MDDYDVEPHWHEKLHENQEQVKASYARWLQSVKLFSVEAKRLKSQTADDLLDYIAFLENRADALYEKNDCPCVWVGPCVEGCTCVDGFSSRGCHRCCTYGSIEQKRAKAKSLAEAIDSAYDK